MTPESSEIANSLSEKYQILHDAFIELYNEASHIHGTMCVDDIASRGLFNSLSRILAFSDQVHVGLNLMGEDVRAIEEVFGDDAPADWSDQIEECLDEWLSKVNLSSSKVN